MKTDLTRSSLAIAPIVLLVVIGVTKLALAQPPTPQERVAALKNSLAVSQELLKQYEWIETTVVSVKGEEKSTMMDRCYYGADGRVQKVPISASQQEEKKRGLRGKIAEHKKEEMTEYMKSAVALVKSYIPPDPVRLEASKNAGKMSITPAGPRVRIDFRDYEKPGDMLSIEMDREKNTLLGLQVATWLNDPKDTVTLSSKLWYPQ